MIACALSGLVGSAQRFFVCFLSVRLLLPCVCLLCVVSGGENRKYADLWMRPSHAHTARASAETARSAVAVRLMCRCLLCDGYSAMRCDAVCSEHDVLAVVVASWRERHHSAGS